MKSKPARRPTGTINDVEHVVILMLENRSFDHYFGTMRGVRGFGDRCVIPLESGKPVWYQSDGAREIPPFRLDMNQMNALNLNTTSHMHADAQAAWNQGKYGLWPAFKVDMVKLAATGHSMGYYTREELPFQFALADAFTICDNYHCSVISGTDPNRVFLFSGCVMDPAIRDGGRSATPPTPEPNNLRGWVGGTWPDPGYEYLGDGLDWPTIPELLEEAGISWRIYQDPNDNFMSMNGCLAFNSFRNAKPGSPLYENGMSHWSLDDFASHVRNGTLPQVSWILPTQAQSEHAGGSSTARGADFTNRCLQALAANPDVWSTAVMFITFDENDGWFDHVPPPAVPSLNLDGSIAGASTIDVSGMYIDVTGQNEYADLVQQRFLASIRSEGGALAEYVASIEHLLHGNYIDPRDTISGHVRPFGMGPRVPLYVVSPWSKGGWVDSEVFDHTSIAQFLEKRFGITVRSIAPWNRAVSGDLTSAFDFTSPDPSFPALPETRGYQELEAEQRSKPDAAPPAAGSPDLRQEPGTRPSRPTPYELNVNATVDGKGNVSLELVNTGRRGAVFHVYDKKHLDRIPRRYTVEAGKTLTDSAWSESSADRGYDLAVYSTNGFVRTFAGTATSAQLEVRVSYARRHNALLVELRNLGSTTVRAEIVANAYRTDGPWTFFLEPRRSSSRTFDVTASGNWYDFSVIAPAFERRFAGRLENGANLISDPAMG